MENIQIAREKRIYPGPQLHVLCNGVLDIICLDLKNIRHHVQEEYLASNVSNGPFRGYGGHFEFYCFK